MAESLWGLASLLLQKGQYTQAHACAERALTIKERTLGSLHHEVALLLNVLGIVTMFQGREAAAEFQKVLDHRGIVLADPIGALAHLQLGRALALSGDNERAKSAYQDFLTLWNEADPNIPILKQARAEYAKL